MIGRGGNGEDEAEAETMRMLGWKEVRGRRGEVRGE